MKQTPSDRRSKPIFSVSRQSGKFGEVFSEVKVPGVGTAKIINRDVYDRALARADATIRQANQSKK